MLMHKARDDEKKTEERRHEGVELFVLKAKAPFRLAERSEGHKKEINCVSRRFIYVQCRIPDGLMSRDFFKFLNSGQRGSERWISATHPFSPSPSTLAILKDKKII